MHVVVAKPELERFVKDQVEQGIYASADELVELAVAQLMARRTGELPVATSIDELRAKVAVGLAQAQSGELSDGEALFAELERGVGPQA